MRLTMFVTVQIHVSSEREWECGYRYPCPCVVAEDGKMGLDMDMEGVEAEAAEDVCRAGKGGRFDCAERIGGVTTHQSQGRWC
jgi:hypothetical protein